MRFIEGRKSRPLLFCCLAFGGLVTISGCKRSQNVSRTAYIIGPVNDIVPLDEVTEAKIEPDVRHGAVLIATRLQTKSVKFCSGTLIAPEEGEAAYRVLTNHHCFAVPGDDGKATRTLLLEACTNTVSYFGFESDKHTDIPQVDCKPGSLRTNYDGDLAVFTLASNPPEPHRPLKLTERDDIAAGTKAVIVHYPDVPERAGHLPGQKVKLPTMSVTVDDCQVVGNFSVEEWPLDRTLPFSLRHSCDLIHGSSGSALIDAETNEIIGVNWGGIKISYTEELRTENVATKASYVRSFLHPNAEEEVALAKSRVQSQTHDADAKRDESAGSGIEDKAKKTFCGSIGAGQSAPWSAIILLVPVLMLVPRRKDRLCRKHGILS